MGIRVVPGYRGTMVIVERRSALRKNISSHYSFTTRFSMK